jgi:site-specific DNA recombinase
MTLAPRTALYARVSRDRQAQQHTSASQIATIQTFAVARGARIDAALIFADNGLSGTTLARPQLAILRDKAAAGEIEQILILTPDRFARKYTHQGLLVEEFQKLGVTLTCVNRQIAAAPEDQRLLPRPGVSAEYEREKILERYRRGKLHQAPQGNVAVLSGAPYGYGYIPATATAAARYEILDREARLVKRVFPLVGNDHQSIGAIARLLTTEQIPTRREVGKWERAVVWARVRNPAYTGQAA